jgi:hypothetical protein
MAHLRFRRLRRSTLGCPHISDHGLRSLADMDMFHADVLVSAVT